MLNAGGIGWLALESLCAQKTEIKWELIICEEEKTLNTKGNFMGEKKIKLYEDRLKAAGCVRVRYLPVLSRKISLSRKWKVIAAESSTKIFMLQAADCYSHPQRIQKTFEAFAAGHDWYMNTKGLFYHLTNKKTILYDHKGTTHPTALNMAIATELIRNLPEHDLSFAVDFWIYTKSKPKNPFKDGTLYPDGVDTHGANNISKRELAFSAPTPPWYPTNILLTIPFNVMSLL